MSFDPNKITFFAKTDARGAEVPFGIKAIDRTKHMYVIGKTGMGKSTLLENIAVQDIANGEGMAFIDPHGQTAETLLDYIPEERKDDVLYFAPFDTDYPVAFNVMEDVGPDKRHLVVSGLMSVFKKIWVDAWSARMEYILQNTLLALLEYPDSTLLGVNRMLSDKVYRRKVIDNISDPAVKSFWVDEFLNYNERYMQEAGDSIKNKIGQFTANPLIRNVIGQPKSSFDIRKIMDEKKIIIMNLSKGLVGESNANLLGSMLTTRIYLAAMSRADLPVEEMKQMPNFYFYVDEFQSFANATFADILSEARKYKLNLTIAHQYIEQMEEEVKNAVFGNVGTICAFRVGPFDAETLETIFAPQFYAVDICNLGFAQIYLTLMIDGIGSKPFSASTLPPIQPRSESCKQIVIHRSREQFARERSMVEADINAWHEPEVDDRPKKSNSNGGDRKPPADRPRSPERRDQKPRSEAPRKSEPRDDRRPAPSAKPEKSLDELRAVLQGLATKDDKKSKPEQPKPSPAPELAAKTPATPAAPVPATTAVTSSQPPATQPSAEKPVEKTEGATPAATPKPHAKPAPRAQKPVADSPVKQALADVLADIAKPSTASQSASSQPSPKTEPPQAAALAVTPASEAAAPKSETPKPAVSNPSTEQTKPQTSAKPSDPLDPKVLERMMRVTTADKTPLK